jgi:hypothetical protein
MKTLNRKGRNLILSLCDEAHPADVLEEVQAVCEAKAASFASVGSSTEMQWQEAANLIEKTDPLDPTVNEEGGQLAPLLHVSAKIAFSGLKDGGAVGESVEQAATVRDRNVADGVTDAATLGVDGPLEQATDDATGQLRIAVRILLVLFHQAVNDRFHAAPPPISESDRPCLRRSSASRTREPYAR